MPKLTKSIVDHAEVPSRGQAFVWCSEDRGFGVRINASGSRTFIAQGRISGKERRISIGRPGVFSVDQARAQARELLRGMRLGVDPVEEKARKLAEASRCEKRSPTTARTGARRTARCAPARRRTSRITATEALSIGSTSPSPASAGTTASTGLPPLEDRTGGCPQTQLASEEGEVRADP
jgi:hypothetical protein